MKIFTTLVLAVSLAMLGACSTKNSSYSHKGKATKKSALNKKSPTPKSTISAASISCEMNQDRRRIEVEPVSTGGCQVNYEKGGSSQTIAEARNDLSYCGQVKDKVLRNLQQAGFQCEHQVADSDTVESLQ